MCYLSSEWPIWTGSMQLHYKSEVCNEKGKLELATQQNCASARTLLCQRCHHFVSVGPLQVARIKLQFFPSNIAPWSVLERSIHYSCPGFIWAKHSLFSPLAVCWYFHRICVAAMGLAHTPGLGWGLHTKAMSADSCRGEPSSCRAWLSEHICSVCARRMGWA